MKRIALILFISFLLFSCSNTDLIIKEGETTNCESFELYSLGKCSMQVERACDKNDLLSYLEKNERIKFELVKPVFLINTSENKIYQVTIKRNNNGDVIYEDYLIKQTDSIQLGPNKDFIINYNHYETPSYESSFYYCLKGFRIKILSKENIVYTINDYNIIKEYN